MKKIAVFIALHIAASVCIGSEIKDCGTISGIKNGMVRSPENVLLLDVKGNFRNSQAIEYAKDDPVLIADLTLVNAVPVLMPDSNFVLKSTWMMSPNYRFNAREPITATYEVVLTSGKKMRLIRLDDGSTLFLDSEGNLCNKALNEKPDVWIAGTLSMEPSVVKLEDRIIENKIGVGSLRIIFNGIQSGALNFQEVWVNGATIVASTSKSFDQFATTVEIGPFNFNVLNTSGGKVTLKYDIASRALVDASIRPKLVLRRVR